MATFILVHGTFAKEASWPELEAGLAETANAANEKASFERVLWTGKNRASARQAAGEMILAAVKRVRSASVTEKIFIIGHSHGGSAIAYFLKSYPETAKTLSGCAFLSTPFIAIRPRQNALQLYYIMGTFISASLLAMVLYLTIGAPKPFYQDYVVLIYGAASLLVALALWLGDDLPCRTNPSESSFYFPFAFSPSSTSRPMASGATECAPARAHVRARAGSP
jgi:pimeloyl-ACP methyl ester carboxylesterase